MNDIGTPKSTIDTRPRVFGAANSRQSLVILVVVALLSAGVPQPYGLAFICVFVTALGLPRLSPVIRWIALGVSGAVVVGGVLQLVFG